MYDFNASNNNDLVNMKDGSVQTKQQVLNDPNTKKIDTTQSGLGNSLNKLYYNTKAQGNALGSMFTGNQEMMDNALYNNQISQSISKPYEDITQVKSLGDFGNWATDMAVQNASLLIPGGIIGKGVQKAGETIAKNLLKKNIDNAMSSALFKTGLGTTMGTQNLAQQNLTNLQDNNQNISAEQALASFGSGATLGVLEGNALLGLKNRSGLLASMGQTGATAGGLNIAQSAVNRGILGKDLANEQALTEYANAGAGGFAFGAPFGAFNRAKPTVNTEVSPETSSNSRDLALYDNNSQNSNNQMTQFDPFNGSNFREIPGTDRNNTFKNNGEVAQSFDINNPVDPNFQIEIQKRLPYNESNANKNEITKYKNNDLNDLSSKINDSIDGIFREIPGTERNNTFKNNGEVAQSFDINNPVDPNFQIEAQKRLPYNESNANQNEVANYNKNDLSSNKNDIANTSNFREIPGTDRNNTFKNNGEVAQSFDINNPVDPNFQIEAQKRLPYNESNANQNEVTNYNKNDIANISNFREIPGTDRNNTFKNNGEVAQSFDINNPVDPNFQIETQKRLPYNESNNSNFEFTKDNYNSILEGFKINKLKSDFKDVADTILNDTPSEQKVKLLGYIKENLQKEGTTLFDNISFLKDLKENAPKINEEVAKSINDKIEAQKAQPKENINPDVIPEVTQDVNTIDNSNEKSNNKLPEKENKNTKKNEFKQFRDADGFITHTINGIEVDENVFFYLDRKDNNSININENTTDFDIFNHISKEIDNQNIPDYYKDGDVIFSKNNMELKKGQDSIILFKNDEGKYNTIVYEKDGVIHNENGPARIENGKKDYALEGVYIDEKDFNRFNKEIYKQLISEGVIDNLNPEDLQNLIEKRYDIFQLNDKLNEKLPQKSMSEQQSKINDNNSNTEKFNNAESVIKDDGTKINTFEENGNKFQRAEFKDGLSQFYKDGELHRDINDGPAVDWGDKSINEYWVNGKEVKVSFDKDGNAYIKKSNTTKNGKTKLSEEGRNENSENRIKEELPSEINDIVSDAIGRNDTESAVKIMKEYFSISKEKQAIIDSANKFFDPIRKMVNVGIEVISPEHSPYYDGASAWFDPINNKIFIVNKNEGNRSILSSLLRHELFHKGIQNTVSKEGLQSYYKAMDELYNNREVRAITDKLMIDIPELANDKYTAVEEALARLVENGRLDKMPVYKKIMDFFKTFLNKIIGNKDFVSDSDVKAFLDKTEKSVFESPEQQAQYINNINNTIKFSMRGLNDPIIEKAIQDTNNDPRSNGFASIISNMYQNVMRDGIKKTLDNKINSEDPWNSMNNSPLGKWTKKFYNTSIAGYIMTKDALLKATGPIGSKIIDIQDLKNTLEGNAKAGLVNVSQKAMQLIKLIAKADTDKLNQVLDTFAYHREMDADGKIIVGNKGVRLTRIMLETELKSKGFSGERLKNVMELAIETRRISDFGIYSDALNDSILIIETFKNILKQFDPQISNKINDLIDKTIRSEFPFEKTDDTYINHKNLNTNLKEIIGQDTLGKLAIENKENFDMVVKYIQEIDNIYGKANELENRGYIHRDFSGRYVVRMVANYTQKNGKVVQKTVGVFANDDKSLLDSRIEQMSEEFKNVGADVGKKGENKQYTLLYEKRADKEFNSINIAQALLQLANDVNLTDAQKKVLSIVQKNGDDFAREFKGYGENQNIQEVAYNYGLKKVRDTSNNYMQADINSIIASMPPNSVERVRIEDIMNNIQKNINHKNSALVEKWKGFTSLMALGFSVPNNIAQLFQTAQLRQSIFEKYGQSAYDYSNSFLNNKKALNYIKYGSSEISKTGIPELDAFIEQNKNNELFGSSMNKELFAMQDGFDKNSWNDLTNSKARNKVINEKGYLALGAEALSLVKEEAYNMNGYFERSLRMTTVLQSYDVYKAYKDGKITDPKILSEFKIDGKDKTLQQFIFDNLRVINGDFSKRYRSAVFNSDLGQVLLQFQQWKPLTINAYTNMSTKGKIAFGLTNAFAFGGLSGIPFSDDLMNISDEILKMFGAEPFFRNKIEKMAKAIRTENPNFMTEMASAYMKHGLPLIGERVALGKFTPFVQGLTELPDDTNKGVKDLVGPSVNTLTSISSGVTQIAKGNIAQGLITASPTALKNVAKGINAGISGNVTSADGVTKMYDTNFLQATALSLGFKTPSIQNEMDRNQVINDYRKFRQQEKINIQNDYVKAFRNKDFSSMSTLRQESLKDGYDIDFSKVLENSNKNNKGIADKSMQSLSESERLRLKRIIG